MDGIPEEATVMPTPLVITSKATTKGNTAVQKGINAPTQSSAGEILILGAILECL